MPNGYPHFVIRTIRNGRVKILGNYYETREPLLDFHEGMRAAFALYFGPRNSDRYDHRGIMDGVALWGSEKAFHDHDEWPGPFCDEYTRTFKWEWWRRVDE